MDFMMINGTFLPKNVIFNKIFQKTVFAKIFNLFMLQNSFEVLIYNFCKGSVNMNKYCVKVMSSNMQ